MAFEREKGLNLNEDIKTVYDDDSLDINLLSFDELLGSDFCSGNGISGNGFFGNGISGNGMFGNGIAGNGLEK